MLRAEARRVNRSQEMSVAGDLSRRSVWVLLLAVTTALALHAPTLRSGLLADDFLHDAMLRGTFPVERSAWDLYAFVKSEVERSALIDRGVLPWWSHPDLRLAGLRPLASLSLALDHALGLSPPLRHAVSLGWFALLVVLAGVWYRRVLPPAAATIALFVFALDPAHVSPVGWLANRTTVMCGVFVLLALLATESLLTRPTRAKQGAVVLATGLALASGEYALSGVGIAVGWLLLSGRGTPRSRRVALALWLGPTLAYLGLHLSLGYGAVGSSNYVNLLASPSVFALAMVLRLPALLASESFLLPGELVHGALVLDFGMSIVLVALLVGAAWLVGYRVLRESGAAPRAQYLAASLGLVLAVLPLVATLPSFRLLAIPSLAGAALVALLLAFGLTALRRSAWIGRVLLFAALSSALFIHTALAGGVSYQSVRAVTAGREALAAQLAVAKGAAGADTWLLLNAWDLSFSWLPWAQETAGGVAPPAWRVLATCSRPLTLTRTGPSSFTLSAKEAPMLADPGPALFRAIDAPLVEGSTVTLRGLRVRVDRSARWGVSQLAFTLDDDLDAERYAFFATNQGRLERVRMPQVGSALELPSAAP